MAETASDGDRADLRGGEGTISMSVTGGEVSTGRSSAFLPYLQRFARRRPRLSPRVGLLIALPIFVGATAIAIVNLPEIDGGFRWPLLAAAGGMGLVGTAVNAWEFRFAVGLLDKHVGVLRSIRVSVLATAANVFPVPGAVLVRVAEMRRLGASLGAALHATLAIGLGLVSTAFILSGLFQVIVGPGRLLGSLVTAAGVAALAATGQVVAARAGRQRLVTRLARLVVIQVSSVAVKAAALGLAAASIGYSLSITQLLALTLAQVIALALGIFPAGLGVTELLSAAISPFVGMSAAVGLLANAVLRVANLIVSGILAALVFAVEGREAYREMQRTVTENSIDGV